jgi:phage FluMu gp28-like protein
MVAILSHWRVGTAAVDATGLGQPIAELLVGALGASRVRPVSLTAQSKSELGFGLLSAINTGALQLPAADRDAEPWRTFWREARACERVARAGAQMGWRAPAGQHEDSLVALALVAHAARFAAPGHAAGVIGHPERYPDQGRY